MINRNAYLYKLINSRNNGSPKVITGVRRPGKSYLLKEIYRQYLLESGVKKENIIIIELDDLSNAYLRNPYKLLDYVRSKIINKDDYYVFIDEIQLVTKIYNPEFTGGKIIVAKESETEDVITFVDVVLALSRIENVDVYVTGSNSKMLSSDIVTEFRDKATNIKIKPLSFEEFCGYKQIDPNLAIYEYMQYGGMPLAVLSKDDDSKKEYLKKPLRDYLF